MTDHTEDQHTEPEMGRELDPKPRTGILGNLRAEQDASSAKDGTLKMRLPTRKLLYAAFKYVAPDDIIAKPEKYDGLPDARKIVYGAADTLVLTLDQFYINQDGEFIRLCDLPEVQAFADDPDIQEQLGGHGRRVTFDTPIGFDQRLRVILGLPITPGRGSARQTLFDVYQNEYSVIEHAQKLERWMKDTSRASEAGILGE